MEAHAHDMLTVLFRYINYCIGNDLEGTDKTQYSTGKIFLFIEVMFIISLRIHAV